MRSPVLLRTRGEADGELGDAVVALPDGEGQVQQAAAPLLDEPQQRSGTGRCLVRPRPRRSHGRHVERHAKVSRCCGDVKRTTSRCTTSNPTLGVMMPLPVPLGPGSPAPRVRSESE